jgi:hypothetical protein
MYDFIGIKCSHRKNNKMIKKIESYARKAFSKFTTKDNYACNITRNTGNTAIWILKPKPWGSPVAHEK